MTRALILLSGGLDSRLVCRLLQEQGIQVEAVFFLLPFSKNNSKEIKKFCNKNDIKLHIINLTTSKLFQEYLNIIRNPRYPRGTALNPCIDCHIFMIKIAKKLANKLKIEIIATGEVLGERPLSQTKRALLLIDKELGFDILRPLSAKLLPETEYENKKLIDRKKLLDIQGRQRKRQIELAEKFEIDYPSPGGGCLLCEPEYCKKLKPILNNENLTYNNIKLLSTGRHFSNSEIILGRNEKENNLLEKEPGIKIIPEQPGATALVKIKNKKLIEKAKKLIQKYSRHKITRFEIK